MAEPLQAQQGFRFLSLPENVREKVYTYLLVKHTPFKPYLSRPIRRYFTAIDSSSILLQAGLCLLRTSKQIHREATEILYGRNLFHFESHAYPITSCIPDDFRYPNFHPPQSEPCIEFLARLAAAGNLSKVQFVDIDFERYQERHLGKAWEDPRFEFITWHEEKLDPDVCPEFWDPNDDVDSNATENGDDDTDRSWGWLEEDLDAELYPKWRRVNGLRSDFQKHVASTLEYLVQCKHLQRLEIWFPDPQRFAAGWICISEGGPVMEVLQRLNNVRDLIVHGIEELGTLRAVAQASNVTAELHSSLVRPHLHVEAGRANLRAVSGWQVQQSSKDRIMLQRVPPSRARADFFAGLPPEIRTTIFKLFFSSQLEDFCDREGLFSVPYLSRMQGDGEFSQVPWRYCWPQPYHSPETVTPVGKCSILYASRLVHREAASVFYNIFPFNLRIDPPQVDFQFLRRIGEDNRNCIRHLWIDWHTSVQRYIERLRFLPVRPRSPVCYPEMEDFARHGMDDEEWNVIHDREYYNNYDYSYDGFPPIMRTSKTAAQIREELVSQMFRTLTLLQNIPVLDWLYLSLPGRTDIGDEVLFKDDLFKNDRFFHFCSKMPKVRCLWIEQWHIHDLSRCETLGRNVKAEKVYVYWKYPADYLRRYSPPTNGLGPKLKESGWEISGCILSKCLNTAADLPYASR